MNYLEIIKIWKNQYRKNKNNNKLVMNFKNLIILMNYPKSSNRRIFNSLKI